MCGIVGQMGNLNNITLKLGRDMHLVDTVRGRDSSGIISIPMGPKAEPIVVKELGAPTNLWDWGNEKIFDKNGTLKSIPKALICHNRAATIGNVTKENAHPFEYGDIIGVHNGSLRSWDELNPDKEFDVDSMALINSIDKVGIEETWKRFHGAACIVWWDKKDSTVNMARNAERPMFICENGAKNVTYFASEADIIRFCAKREKVTLSDEDGHNMRYLSPDKHYKFEVTATSCKIVGVTNLEKKSHIVEVPKKPKTTSKASSTQTVGFKGGTQYTKSKQLNTDWAKNTEKLGKKTRGVRFTLSGLTSEGYIVGKIVDSDYKGIRLEVIPNCPRDRNLLLAKLGSITQFQTRARVRQVIEDELFRISSANIREMVDLKQNKPDLHVVNKDNHPEVGAKIKEKQVWFDGPNGTKVSPARWREMLGKNCDCAWCGNPVVEEDHKDIFWLTSAHSSEHEILCAECKGDDSVITSLYGMYPNMPHIVNKEA